MEQIKSTVESISDFAKENPHSALIGLTATTVGTVALTNYVNNLPPARGKIVETKKFTDSDFGGQVVADSLARHQIKFVFTLTGGHISPILVGCNKIDIRVIDVRHEVTTVFAADAVARCSGIPGVAIVTAGPGLTNTITAVKNAQMAQSPVILLGGATGDYLKGRGSLQDIDQFALMKPHVKKMFHISSVSQITGIIEQAFGVAQSGTPGPVFIEFPFDVLYARKDYEPEITKKMPPPTNLTNKAVRWYLQRHVNKLYDTDEIQFGEPIEPYIPMPSRSQVSSAISYLSKAKKPILLMGSQSILCQQNIGELVKAVESLGVPTYLTSMARGLLGRNHELHIKHNRRVALKEADVVIMVGSTCDFRLDYGFDINSKAVLIAANRDKYELYKNRSPTLAVQADPAIFIKEVAFGSTDNRQAWSQWTKSLKEKDESREEKIQTDSEQPTDNLNPIHLCKKIEEHLPENAILVADGGDFVGTASYTVRPRAPLGWLDPGVFGTLGVGAGFALGAALCNPEKQVVLLWGDGSCGYSIAEYDTFVRHGINITSIIGNDGKWQQMYRGQVQYFNDTTASVLKQNDYQRVAHGWDAEGIKISEPEEVDQLLSEGFNTGKSNPIIINVLIGSTDFRNNSLSM